MRSPPSPARPGRSAFPNGCRTACPTRCGARSRTATSKRRPAIPIIDPDWGEPGLTRAEKVFGWCTFEMLAMTAGKPETPGQRHAAARLGALPVALRGRHRPGRHPAGAAPPPRPPRLSRWCEIAKGRDEIFAATRARSRPSLGAMGGRLAASAAPTRRSPILPNVGGSLPNDIFTEVLGLPTVWVPHSYPGCSQHAPERAPAAAAGPRGLAADGRALLGSRRRRHAGRRQDVIANATGNRTEAA